MSKLVEITFKTFHGEQTLYADPKSQNIEFLKFCAEAVNKNKFIIVEYNEGWEDYSGIYSEKSKTSPFKRIFSIGLSNGETPKFLEMLSSLSYGGGVLTSHKDAIKNFKFATVHDELYNTLHRVEELSEMTTLEFIREFQDDDFNFDEESLLKYTSIIIDVIK